MRAVIRIVAIVCVLALPTILLALALSDVVRPDAEHGQQPEDDPDVHECLADDPDQDGAGRDANEWV